MFDTCIIVWWWTARWLCFSTSKEWIDSIQGLSCQILKERSLKKYPLVPYLRQIPKLLYCWWSQWTIAWTSKVGIPSRLRVLTAAARLINESSSAREIKFQHVTPINNVGVACSGKWIREIISPKFSKTAIRENLDPRNFCAIRYLSLASDQSATCTNPERAAAPLISKG